MTEHDTALAFDRALNGERDFDLNGSDSLLAAAQTLQTRFDQQQASPSEEFIMQLERTLLASPVVLSRVEGPLVAESSFSGALAVGNEGSLHAGRDDDFVVPSAVEGPPALLVVPSAVEGPPAGAVSRPQPTSSLAPIRKQRTHATHRWIAIAAALLLLLIGGAGAIIFGPFDPRSIPEPSAIPAASFATVAASPSPLQTSWRVDPPASTTGSDRPGLIANGIMFRTFMGGSQAPIQAVALRTGTVLWEKMPTVIPQVMATAGNDLLIAGSENARMQVIALDGQTGAERWTIDLAQRPVGLRVADDRVFVLGKQNLLEAYDLEDQQRLWSADLSQYDEAESTFSGANQFLDLTSDRLAFTDGIVGAIVSNGRLVAVDADDGAVKWADERTTDGWTRLTVVDGKFVVIAFGGEQLLYDPAATPLPITPSDPTADPCALTIQSRAGSKPVAAAATGETVDSFDPETGESPWGLALPEQYQVWPAGAFQLLAQVEPVQSAGIGYDGELFPCLIDGSTGAVSESTVEKLTTFVFVDATTGTNWGIVALPRGIRLWLGEIDPETARALPRIELDLATIGGQIRWVQQDGDLLLITGQDGSLTAFADRESTVATPTGGSANTGSIV